MNDANNIVAGARLPDIMRYESDIWAVADLLIAASVKQSDFPAYMMPFFALMMLEGRMRNAVRALKAEYKIAPDETPDGFEELFTSKGVGFNKFIVLENKRLADICRNDTTFEDDFRNYLNAFDSDLRRLLGIGRGHEEQKFLNMDGIVAELRGKGILMQVTAQWAAIDLSPYDNSAITTLEEHIKRKWADISASTAGEQYTPDDIISLIAEIVASKVKKPKDKIVHLYDPTCGGANLLFGVEDRLRGKGYAHIASYGSEYNDALYALAAIESRFREFSKIEYGNTLTRVPFSGTQFDVVVANPPYGTPWKGFANDIKNDQRGQFAGGHPGTGDGQFLFMQHILWQLDSEGLAVVVADGSTLFSGDAGGGESNIRKYIFDHDWVEAIVQMPQQEFFNTGITTYLWILNKNKPTERRNLVALIDASKGWSQLKKSKGDKRREMTQENRAAIVNALAAFRPSDICKIFDREHFYYNKQKVVLTELDENGKHVERPIDFVPARVQLGEKEYDEVCDLEKDQVASLLASVLKYAWEDSDNSIVHDADEGEVVYRYDPGKKTVCKETGKKHEELGCGEVKFTLKAGSRRGTKSLKVEIGPKLTTDYEIIPHHFDKAANDAEIAAFIKKYIFKPCRLAENKVGVELNFNKEFYVPERLDSVEDILAEIRALDAQLAEVELSVESNKASRRVAK